MPSFLKTEWVKYAVFLVFISTNSPTQACVAPCRCSQVYFQGKSQPELIVNCSSRSLSYVPNIPAETTQLFLSNNQLRSLDSDIFKSLPNLWKLDISNNNLKYLKYDIFKFNSKIYDLNLLRNPLVCDCNLYGIHNISQHVTSFLGSCSNPSTLAQRQIKSLKVEEYCGGCLGIKLSGRGSIDKVYYMKVNAKCKGTVPIFCSGMNTSSPKEYIPLKRHNYAYIHDYMQPMASKFLCDRQPGGTIYNQTGLTNFTKLRVVLNASGAYIKNDDFSFATSNGNPVPLGVAGDCYSALDKNCRKGKFHINLAGTGFRLQEGVYWGHYGIPSNIQSTLDIDTERQDIYAECGGYCGGCRPQTPLLLELKSCPLDDGIKSCRNALGMDDRSIHDNQITASSFKTNYEPSNGRLNHIKTASKGGSWCADKSNLLQYLQIDLGKQMTLSGISSQGSGETQEWVTEYKMQKSSDGRIFNDHTEFGIPKELTGNTDNFNIVTHWFSQRFRARFVRIVPIKWNSAICLRVELLGCNTDVVSVAVRHKSDGRCWSPYVDSCSLQDSVEVVIKPSCTSVTEMFTFQTDNTIKHTCSGKCAYVDSTNRLALRNHNCHEFRKKKIADSYQLIHALTKKCLGVGNVKTGELILQPCDVSSASFEFTQESISPMAPKITIQASYLELNKPGWVHCQVIADPKPKIYWSKTRPWPGGQRLSKLDFLEWSNGSLYVRHTRMEYAGRYYCSAANTADFVFAAFDIKVGTQPEFIKAPNYTEVNWNNTALMNCVVANSNLPTKISWFKKTSHDSTSISIDKLDHRFLILSNMSLKISKVKKEDGGYYTCRSSNPLGSINQTAVLRVLVPPTFFIFPKSIEIPSSSSPLLKCKGVGDPRPNIKWSRKNGLALPKNAKVYGNGSLFIRNIQLVDQGSYICSATSRAGSAHIEITIKVYGACRLDSIPFASYHPSHSIFFRVGSVITITCMHGFNTRQGPITNMTCVSDRKFDKALPKCKDIDECRVDPATDENNHDVTSYHECHKNALCMNTIGSYRCECSEGFKGNGTYCLPLCPRPANPPNSIGFQPDKKYYDKFESTKVLCSQGFTTVHNSTTTCDSTGSFGSLPQCQDIDECTEANICKDINKICENFVGTYQCHCKLGLEEDNNGKCKVSAEKKWRVSQAIQLLQNQIKNSQSTNLTDVEILKALRNETNKKNLLSGDLIAVYEILKSLSNKAENKQKQQIETMEIDFFSEVCSNILDKRNKVLWENIQKESKGVTMVLKLIDDYLSAMTNNVINKSISTFSTKNSNLEIKIDVQEAQMLYKGYTYSNRQKHSQIEISGNIFKSYQEGSKLVIVTSVNYKTLSVLLPQIADGVQLFDVESQSVISTSLHPKPFMDNGKLAGPVRIIHGGEKTTQKDGITMCVFWDFEKNVDKGGSWSSRGCRVISSSRNTTICECDHMTAYASLAVYDEPFAFTLVVYVACGILMLAVIILVIRHLYLYCKLKSERSIIHLNICFAIASCLGLFVGTLTLIKIKVLCIAIAALLHYFLTATFCWIIAKCLQICQTLTTGKNKNYKRIKWFYIVGWCLPAIVVGISLGVFQLQGYGNEKWCWLDYDHMLMWAFAGPIAFFVFVTFILIVVNSVIKARVVDSSDKTKVSVSLAMAMLLSIAVACTWVTAAIYVKNHQLRLWEYTFAGSCVLQAIILLLFGIFDKEIKNFSFLYQIKKIQQKEHKEKRNYYSTTDTIQYYGAANAPDGKAYTVTRPSMKESNQDLRGSSKRLARMGSNLEVSELLDYPTPIVETPVPLDESYKRTVEDQPVPYTPSFPNSEVIQLQTFPARRGYQGTPASSDRQPDGAEYPEPSLYGDHRYRSNSPRDSSSNQSKLAQIPERSPLMKDYKEADDRLHSEQNVHDSKPQDEERKPLNASRRRSQRSRARLEEQFPNDLESIKRRKKKLRYSSGYLIGATIDDDNMYTSKDHASL